MNPKRWHQVEQIYNSVLERKPEERDAFLEKACAGDAALRKEVESLLACNDEAAVFIESPAMEEAAKALAEDGEHRDSLVGRTILHYSIEERIGEGGMGVVYKAHDNRLKRDIAIKVLPDIFAQDPHRLARFEREARAVAALSHPNILGIHDLCSADGLTFAAMELLEGETLRDRLKESGLPVRKALDYAMQMAQGLAAAHERGIVHRDLKPENLFITKEGRVKILDFGLAKLHRDTGPAAESSTRLTRPGALMGTVGYMSPEQVRGQDADARSDIFALGAILYEMLTGQRAFRGNSEADTISAILKEDPPEFTHLQKRGSPSIERVVRRCLEKNAGERFQSARDLSFALEAVGSDSAPADKLPTRRTWSLGIFGSQSAPGIAQTRRRAWLIATAAVLLVVVGTRYWINRREAVGTIDTPSVPVPLTTYPGDEWSPSFSPDGNQVAFAWDGPRQDNMDIYIKLIGMEPPVRLTSDPAEEFSPAWSRDGRYIAFLRTLSNERSSVFLIPAIGGTQRKLADVSGRTEAFLGPYLSWLPDSRWLVVVDKESVGLPSALFLVSVESGEKRRLTSPPRKYIGDGHPAVSPDGRTLVFRRSLSGMTGDVFLLELSENLSPKAEPKRLTFNARSGPVWSKDGHAIVFSAGGSLSPSLWKLVLSGPEWRPGKPERLAFAGDGAIQPAISRQGRLAYAQIRIDTDIWRLELSGKGRADRPATRLISSTRVDHDQRYSPDGKRIAFASNRSGSFEIWVCSSDGSNAVPLTSFGGPYYAAVPYWSPDG